MIVVIAKIVSKSEARDATRDALIGLETPTRAELGCIEYTLYTSPTEPDVFVTVESWQSRAHLDAHFATPHVTQTLAAADQMLAGAPVITVHEVSSTTTL